MKKRNVIILILIIIIIIIITISLFIVCFDKTIDYFKTKSNDNEVIDINKDNTTKIDSKDNIKNNNTENGNSGTTDDDNTSGDGSDTPSDVDNNNNGNSDTSGDTDSVNDDSNNTDNSNNDSNKDQSFNNNDSSTPSNDSLAPTPEPTITYYCPDGYVLNNTTCTSTIAANYVCPSNTTEYTTKYCVNLSDGYESEDGNCPENYGSLDIIGLGTPTIHKCLTLYEKTYTCDDGYVLDGTNCIKTINAQVR